MATLPKLLKAIGYENTPHHTGEEPVDYICASFALDGELPQADVLYICRDAPPGSFLRFSSCGLIFTEAQVAELPCTEDLNCEWCVLPFEDRDLLLSRIQEAIVYDRRKDILQGMDQHLVVQKPSLGIVVRRICEIIQNPVSVYDSSYSVLAMESMGLPVENRVWNIAKTKGSFPPEVAEEFRDIIGDRDISQTPFLCTTHAWTEMHCLVMQLVSTSGRVIGSIAVYEAFRPFRSDDVGLIEDAARLLSSYLEEHMGGAQQCDMILTRLLNGEQPEMSDIERCMKASGHSDRCFYRLGYIGLSGDYAKQRQCDYFRRTISSVSEGIIGVTHQNDIVLLISADELQRMKSILKELIPTMEKHGLCMSLSGCFLDILDVSKMFLMAKKAFVKGQEILGPQVLYYVQDVLFYASLENMSKEQLKRLYEATPYAVIRSYDIEQKTNYCETLVIHCKNMFRSSQTANSLFIHKNSLLYRLNRVSALFGFNLDDFNDIFEFYRGYKLSLYLEYLNRNGGTNRE